MKYFLLPLFLLSILLSTLENTIFSGTQADAIETLKLALETINKQNGKIAQSATSYTIIRNIENLVKYLINNQEFLLEDKYGGRSGITIFAKSDDSTQNSFIDTWGTASNTISKAAYKQATTYEPKYLGSNYTFSAYLLETPNAIRLFNSIANNLKDPQVIKILQSHLKEDPIIIFKNIYYTLLYHWLTYRSLEHTQEERPLDQLISIIESYKNIIIDTNDSKLMTELKRQYKILIKLLDLKTLSRPLEDYLALVRDYMLDIIIPQMQLQPPIMLIPEHIIPTIKEERLEELSKRPEFNALDPNTPLRKMVKEDKENLEQLSPELATPEALLSHLTNLNNQLIQLRATITR